MGKTLEELFLEKLRGMPVPETEVQRQPKGKNKKSRAARVESGMTRTTRKHNVDAQSVHTVTSSNDDIQNTTFTHDAQPADAPQLPTNGQSEPPSNAISEVSQPVAQINNSHVQVCITRSIDILLDSCTLNVS